MKNFFTLTALLSLFTFSSSAQDIIGGGINYSYNKGKNYTFDIYLFTQNNSGISHANTEVDFGDGTKEMVLGTATPYGPFTKWHYRVAHNFGADGLYLISLPDSFRISGIQNIPNSSSSAIRVQGELLISSGPGPNSSPILLNTPNLIYTSGNNVIYNPAAFDFDGDSLSYELIKPSAKNSQPATGAFIDPVTGNFSMQATQGGYALNIKITEWRASASGVVKVGSTNHELLIDPAMAVSLEEKKEMELEVFPNPTSDILNIQSSEPLKGITLTDLGGKTVLYKTGAAPGVTTLDLYALPRGVYLLRLSLANGQIYFEKVRVN